MLLTEFLLPGYGGHANEQCLQNPKSHPPPPHPRCTITGIRHRAGNPQCSTSGTLAPRVPRCGTKQRNSDTTLWIRLYLQSSSILPVSICLLLATLAALPPQEPSPALGRRGTHLLFLGESIHPPLHYAILQPDRQRLRPENFARFDKENVAHENEKLQSQTNTDVNKAAPAAAAPAAGATVAAPSSNSCGSSVVAAAEAAAAAAVAAEKSGSRL